MAKKKILIFLQDGVGGAERMSVLIGKGLAEKGFDVRFALVERGSKSSIRDFIPASLPVEEIANAHPLIMMMRLIGVIRKEKPHVVFSSVMYLNTKILPFNWLFPSVRFVVRCENYLYTFNKRQHRYIRLSYHRADAVIAQTEEMKRELVREMGIDERKITVMQNPVDTQLIDRMVAGEGSPFPNDHRRHIVASGRFAYQKGYDLLTEALALVAQEHDDVDLYIVGDETYGEGKTYQEVMAMAQEKGIAERIHCVGYQKNPYPYYRYADCFVLSSRWEGLPNVMIESLYLGTPVAAFRCIPVVERIVEQGVTGFLAEPGNSQSLAQTISGALQLGRITSGYRSATIEDFVKIVSGGVELSPADN